MLLRPTSVTLSHYLLLNWAAVTCFPVCQRAAQRLTLRTTRSQCSHACWQVGGTARHVTAHVQGYDSAIVYGTAHTTEEVCAGAVPVKLRLRYRENLTGRGHVALMQQQPPDANPPKLLPCGRLCPHCIECCGHRETPCITSEPQICSSQICPSQFPCCAVQSNVLQTRWGATHSPSWSAVCGR